MKCENDSRPTVFPKEENNSNHIGQTVEKMENNWAKEAKEQRRSRRRMDEGGE
jgi:hypothetical protein